MGPWILHPPRGGRGRARRRLEQAVLRIRNNRLVDVRHSTCNVRRSSVSSFPNATNQRLHLVAIDLHTDVDLDATLRRGKTAVKYQLISRLHPCASVLLRIAGYLDQDPERYWQVSG